MFLQHVSVILSVLQALSGSEQNCACNRFGRLSCISLSVVQESDTFILHMKVSVETVCLKVVSSYVFGYIVNNEIITFFSLCFFFSFSAVSPFVSVQHERG